MHLKGLKNKSNLVCNNLYMHVHLRTFLQCVLVMFSDQWHWYGSISGMNREIEKLKLSEMTCKEGVIEVAKM